MKILTSAIQTFILKCKRKTSTYVLYSAFLTGKLLTDSILGTCVSYILEIIERENFDALLAMRQICQLIFSPSKLCYTVIFQFDLTAKLTSIKLFMNTKKKDKG